MGWWRMSVGSYDQAVVWESALRFKVQEKKKKPNMIPSVFTHNKICGSSLNWVDLYEE